MRKLNNNSYGSTYFYMIVIILVFVSLMSIMEYAVFGSTAEYIDNQEEYDLVVFRHNYYENMSYSERCDWLNESQGCGYVYINQIYIDDYYEFPCTGKQMSVTEFNSFVNGNLSPNDIEINVDAWSFLTRVFLLDFTVFRHLGMLGIIIRVFLLLIVAVIVYLMLPFTG